MAPTVTEVMNSNTSGNTTGGGLSSDWGTSWEDFNKLHQRLLTDFHQDFFTSSFDNCNTISNANKSFSSSSSSSDNSVQIKNEKDKFIVLVDSSGFKPEELKVSTFDHVLKIEGKHIEENDSGDCSKYVSRQFSRSYTLPSDCKVQEMTSSFGSGKLTVNVPKAKPAIQEIPSRSVPISVKHESKQSSFEKEEKRSTTPSFGDSVKQVKINHMKQDTSSKQETAGDKTASSMTSSSRTSSPTMTSSSKSPEPPMTSSSIFDNMNRGSNLFHHRWVKPIQLFDEDFFVDSFWNDRRQGSSSGAEDLDAWRKPSFIRSNVGSKVTVNDDDQRFEFIIPTDEYEPQELKVTVLDDVLKIEGKHVEEHAEGQGDKQRKRKSVSKQFSRSYVLPRHVYKMDQVESCLTKAKNLVVKVPKIQPKTNAFNVPIKMM